MDTSLDCHPKDPGSIPRRCTYFLTFFFELKMENLKDILKIHKKNARQQGVVCIYNTGYFVH